MNMSAPARAVSSGKLRSLPGRVSRIGVTLGDAAGIGPEVLVHALLQTEIHRRCQVKLFVAADLEGWARATCMRYGVFGPAPVAGAGLHLLAVPGTTTSGAPQAGKSTEQSRAQAFAALAALTDAAAAREVDAMVTGPVPKAIFDHLQPRPPGQTEFLAGRLGAARFAMMLAGPRLRVVPVTTHIALADVPKRLTTQLIVDSALAAAEALIHWLDLPSPRLAVCGLNPHAGEGGRLGDEEARIIAPAVEKLRQLGIQVEGPVVSDTVFHQAVNGRYDAVLCMYHDQALGPLKTVHFHDAVNLTCGLPLPRLSPDHGTAYDIAGKGAADPTSMAQALYRAERIASRLVGAMERPSA